MRWIATILIWFAVAQPARAGIIEDALAKRDFKRAVAAAASPDELMKVLVAKGDLSIARGVARVAATLEGPFSEHVPTSEWISALAAQFDDDTAIELHAGYTLLIGGKLAEAAGVYDRAVKKAKSPSTRSQAATYLADALEKAGHAERAMAALELAVLTSRRSNRYRSQVGRRIAYRLQQAGDRRYADVLEWVEEWIRAAGALAAERFAIHDAKKREAHVDRVRALYAKGLRYSSPAADWWAAAQVATGDDRYRYLVETVKRGVVEADVNDHAHPAALLDLARECARRGRTVAAAALAKRRLRVGDCAAAWDLLETLPAEYAR